jgi:serine/threonine-protein kinase
MRDCPTPECLDHLLREDLDDAERSLIEAHVEDCATCQEMLHHLVSGAAGPAPIALRAALAEGPPPETSPEVDSFLQHLAQRALTPVPEGSHRPESGGEEPPEVEGYEVLAEVGRGATGVVYRARHRALDRPVALKMILAGPHLSPEARRRFRLEARAIARLRHPNIVQVYDVGEHAGCPYLSLELVEGGTLADRLAGAPRPPDEAARIVATLAEAVDYAHRQGVIHRDLKPANVLLGSPAGGPGRLAMDELKITDFGLGKILPRPDAAGEATTETGTLLGTPAYIAPEQARGPTTNVGPGSDVYSLGAILYELITGRLPFQGASSMETLLQAVHQDPVPPSRLNTRVPRDLDTICLKCLEKESARRYASAEALAEDLRRFGRGEPIVARPVGPMRRGMRWLRRRPAPVAAALLVLVLAALGIRWHQQRSKEMRAAAAAAQDELREAEALRQRYEFVDAAAVLRRARRRLGDDGPAELLRRLEQASQDLELVRRLDDIRLGRALVLMVVKRPLIGRRLTGGAAAARKYAEAFREAGLAPLQDDPASLAARIAASPIRTELVAALDDWADCAGDTERRSRILAVARLADPDPWRDRIRDPANWVSPGMAGELAEVVPVAEQPAQALAALGRRLTEMNPYADHRLVVHPEASFLRRVVAAHPGDFWARLEKVYATYPTRPADALAHYRAALKIRPQTPSVHGGLGVLLFNEGQFTDARQHFQ